MIPSKSQSDKKKRGYARLLPDHEPIKGDAPIVVIGLSTKGRYRQVHYQPGVREPSAN